MFKRMASKARRDYRQRHNAATSTNTLLKVAEYRALKTELASRQPGNLALQGFKVYSQNDEDGILEAIFARVGGNRTFLEIGLQDGTECNTLYLMLQGWRGGWIEASTAQCQKIREDLGTGLVPGRFQLIEGFARANNISHLYKGICELVGEKDLALFSLDIDGNDIYVLEALLAAGARPDVLCLEYNGKFPPPLNISVAFDEERGWAYDDYAGSSLQAFADLLKPYGYGLVTCNLLGVNAFFVKKDIASDLSLHEPIEVWQPLRTYLTKLPTAHTATLKFARDTLLSDGR